MECQTVERIAERFTWASWAIWDDEFPNGDCVEQTPSELIDFVCENCEKLTPQVVLMGLNRSAELEAPFSNFHAPTKQHYDYRLKRFIQDGSLNTLHGAYMTDLVDEVDPDSRTVEMTDEDADVLLEQLQLLGQDTYHVICFGNKPFDGLTQYFDVETTAQSPEMKRATIRCGDLTLELYRVWFYGLYGIHQAKVDVLKRQLERLNETIRMRETGT